MSLEKSVFIVLYMIFVLLGCAPSPQEIAVPETKLRKPPIITKPISDTCTLELAPQVCIFPRWEKGPSSKGDSVLSLNFENMTDAEVAAFISDFSVDLWMPDMGHGSAPVKFKLVPPQKLVLENIYFIMPGFWQVRFMKQDEIFFILDLEVL